MTLGYDARFEAWMATPPQDGARLVEGVYIYGNPAVGTWRFARGIYDEPTVYPDENGIPQTWGQANFEIQLPQQRSSLNMEMTLNLGALEPNTLGLFDRIDPADLAKITYVKVYSWIDPTAMDVPLILPVPRFIMDEVTISSSSVQMQCSGPLLPNFRAGKLYTVEEYPGLGTTA